MKVKKVWAAYFSATGTTEKVVTGLAKSLAKKMQVEFDCFDFTLPDVRKLETPFQEGDVVVFGTPTIAGRVPNVLLKYLATIEGRGALAIPISLYGNRNYDDCLIELRDILAKANFYPIAAGAFIGEHSFSRILGAGRPDEKDMAIVEEFAEKHNFGLETCKDVYEALRKDRRDPRDDFQKPLLKSDILSIENLSVGMELEGTVRNVVKFGAFVDIGLKNDALLHISAISDEFVSDPSKVLSVGQIIKVRIKEIDKERGRVGLTRKKEL